MKKKIKIQIPQELADDLRVLLELDEDVLEKISSTIHSNRSLSSTEEIEKAVSQIIDQDAASTFTAFAVATSAIDQNSEIEIDEFLPKFRESLAEKGWEGENLEKLNTIWPIFLSLQETAAFNRSARFLEAQRHIGKHLHSLSFDVFTKPVFGFENEKLIGLIGYTQLTIVAATEDEKESELSVVLNLRQLKRLQEDCLKVINRLESLRNTKFADSQKLIILGDVDE